jgi:subtilisin family serine protease
MFQFTNDRWVFERPRFLDAWTKTAGDAGAIVAIVDTGVNPTVADLQGALLPGYDFYDDDVDAAVRAFRSSFDRCARRWDA